MNGAYKMGYQAPAAAAQPLLKRWKCTSLNAMAGAAFKYWAAIVSLGFLSLRIWEISHVGGLAFYVLILLPLTGRSLRGLENLVHWASHYHWSTNRRVNDWLSNPLVAVPLLQTVGGFRSTHQPHHQELGSDNDPCRIRYLAVHDLPGLDRTSPERFITTMLPRLCGYFVPWFRTTGSGLRTLAMFLAWHGIVLTLGATWIGWRDAVSAWLLFFALPMLGPLTLIRFIAEAAEHDYINNDGTVIGATFNNTGLIHWFFHPAADGWHTLHHLLPSVTPRYVREADAWLSKHDPAYRNTRRRTRVLQNA